VSIRTGQPETHLAMLFLLSEAFADLAGQATGEQESVVEDAPLEARGCHSL